jgi:hypothetical protein
VLTPSMPPKAPVKQVTANRMGTSIDQFASVARKLIMSNSSVYNNPFAIPKDHPRLPDLLADTKPPANEAQPCTPNTQGSMSDSFREEPINRMDNTIAPMASHMPDQYNPEATGDAVRKPDKREKELKKHHSFVRIRLYQHMVQGANLVQAHSIRLWFGVRLDFHLFRAKVGDSIQGLGDTNNGEHPYAEASFIANR